MIGVTLEAGIALVTVSFAIGAQALRRGRCRSTTWASNISTSSCRIPRPRRRFYCRIFTSALHQQPVRDSLRYFVLLGDLPADRQVGASIGAAGQRQPAIGHYCVLATVYDRAGMASALQGAGFGVAGAGPAACGPSALSRAAAVPTARRSGHRGCPIAAPDRTRRTARAARCRSHAAARQQSREVAAILPDVLPRPNGHATPTGVSGFTWHATLVLVSKRRRQARRRRSLTTRSRLHRSTAARSTRGCAS